MQISVFSGDHIKPSWWWWWWWWGNMQCVICRVCPPLWVLNLPVFGISCRKPPTPRVSAHARICVMQGAAWARKREREWERERGGGGGLCGNRAEYPTKLPVRTLFALTTWQDRKYWQNKKLWLWIESAQPEADREFLKSNVENGCEFKVPNVVFLGQTVISKSVILIQLYLQAKPQLASVENSRL